MDALCDVKSQWSFELAVPSLSKRCRTFFYLAGDADLSALLTRPPSRAFFHPSNPPIACAIDLSGRVLHQASAAACQHFRIHLSLQGWPVKPQTCEPSHPPASARRDASSPEPAATLISWEWHAHRSNCDFLTRPTLRTSRRALTHTREHGLTNDPSELARSFS